jgi:hypothetical protein
MYCLEQNEGGIKMNMGKMMITMKLMACFILVFLVLLVGCSSEKSEWEKAQSKNTIEAYETYLSKYPKGKFSMEALAKIEELAFTDAQQKNTIEAYAEYLKKCPQGKAKLSGDLASVVEAYINAKERITISNKNVTEIQGISPIVGKGKISFKKGNNANQLKIEIHGKVPVNKGKTCEFAMENISIGPNLMVPIKFFYDMPERDLSDYGIVIDSVKVDADMELEIGQNTNDFLVSGPKGAILKKKGKGFLLIDGEAYFLRTEPKKTPERKG